MKEEARSKRQEIICVYLWLILTNVKFLIRNSQLDIGYWKLVIIVYLCGIFPLPSCFKKPTWETNVTIPLVSKLFRITEYIDTSNFVVNIDSSISFFKSGKLDTVFLLDSIHINNRSDSSHTALSEFAIRNYATIATGLDANEVTGLELPDSTIYINIPPFNRQIDRTLTLNNIREVSIKSCVLRLTMINNSRLTFDSVNCTVNSLGTISIQGIDSLSTTEISQYFEDVNLDSSLSFTIFLASNGTGAESILISRYDSVNFIITFDSLRINSGSFRSDPPQLVRSSKERYYSLSSNYRIRINDLVCRSGQISIDLDNRFPFPCSLQVSIPELSFDTSLCLQAFNSINHLLNLANRNYHNSSDSLTPLTLRTLVVILLDTNFIYVGPENSINVGYQLTDLKIDSIAGTIIDTIAQRFTDDTVAVDLPDFLSRVQAVNVYAMLDITNAVAFPIDIKLTVSAKNTSDDSASVDTTFSITPGTPANPQISTITMDFTQLFNIHPDYAVLNIQLSSVGDGWMNRASYNTASYTIMSPLRIVFIADTVSFDPDTVRISKDIRNIVRDYANSSIFFAHLQNHLPASLSGKIILENMQYDTVSVGITIPRGIVDNFGIVTAPVDTNITFSLDELQTKIFTDSIVKATLILYIPDTDTITITGRDYFKVVNSYAQIETSMPPTKKK